MSVLKWEDVLIGQASRVSTSGVSKAEPLTEGKMRKGKEAETKEWWHLLETRKTTETANAFLCPSSGTLR